MLTPTMTVRALDGFVIGITADRRWSEQAELLQRRGATVLHGPTIRTEYLASDDALRAATHGIIATRPDYLVATTGIGMRAWFEAVQAWGLSERLLDALGRTSIVARGPKATAAVHTAGLDVWASPDSERLQDVLDALRSEPLTGRTVAFQHYGERNGWAVDALVAAGAEVIEVPIYRWQLPDDTDAARRLVVAVCDGRVDAVTFTSAPAVINLLAVARDAGLGDDLLAAFNRRDIVAVCIGPVCVEGARAAGLERPIAPERGRLGLMVRALTDVLQQRRQTLRLAGEVLVVQGRSVCIGDRLVDLPERERTVFRALLGRRGAVVSKPAILRSLGDGVTPHALDATVGRLRRRLGPAGPAIRAVRGRGYLLDAEPVP
jgi:uroporphyrinogen-III synthase